MPYRTGGFDEHDALFPKKDGDFIALDASLVEDGATRAIVQDAIPVFATNNASAPLEEEQRAGRLFHFSVDPEERARVRVLVGKVPLETRPLRAHRTVRGVRLDVPTGALVICPMNHFGGQGIAEDASMPVTLDVPAGHYDLEYWELERKALSPEEEEEKEKDRDRRHSVRDRLGCLGAVLTVAGVLLAIALAVAAPRMRLVAGGIVLGIVVYWSLYVRIARWEQRRKGPDPEHAPTEVLIVLAPSVGS